MLEIFVIILLVYFFYIYKKVSAFLTTIDIAILSIEENDLSFRIQKVGIPIVDKLIKVYNEMILKLRNERIELSSKNFIFNDLIESSSMGIAIIEYSGRIRSINTAGVNVLGLDFSGQRYEDITHPLFAAINSMKEVDSKIINISSQLFRLQKYPYVDRGIPNAVVVFQDLTKDVFEKERLAYEKVIKMMSHEINNSIGAVNSILDTLVGYKNSFNEYEQDEFVQALQIAIERNDQLTSFTKNFAEVIKIPEPQKQHFLLSDLCKSVVKFMTPYFQSRSISVELSTSQESPMIFADRTQMEQVLINILKNSGEAIVKNGSIIISYSANPVSFSIIDNGKGLSQQAQESIFTPFFSTKKNGQGIGLTLIREILSNHNCRFRLFTKKGVTCFECTF